MPVALNTHVWGAGNSRRILLIHGITSSLAGWWRVAPDLAERGWEVMAVDLRGHGDSPDPGSYLFAEHVDDLMALGTGWDAVLGHSMGGLLAVLTSTASPVWAGGLVLQDPALMIPEPMSRFLDWLLEEYLVDVDPVRIARLNPRWDPRDVAAKVEVLAKTSAEMVSATVETNWPWMVLEEAAALSVPTIVLGSDPEAGGIFPVAFGEWLAQSPRIEYSMIPGSSHSTHRDSDQYETYLTTLVEALERLPTVGR